MCRISSVATLPAVQVLGPELEELSRMVEDMTSLYPQEGKQLRQPAAGDYCVACFEVGTARVHTCTCARMCTHTHTHTQTHTDTHTHTQTHTRTHRHTHIHTHTETHTHRHTHIHTHTHTQTLHTIPHVCLKIALTALVLRCCYWLLVMITAVFVLQWQHGSILSTLNSFE